MYNSIYMEREGANIGKGSPVAFRNDGVVGGETRGYAVVRRPFRNEAKEDGADRHWLTERTLRHLSCAPRALNCPRGMRKMLLLLLLSRDLRWTGFKKRGADLLEIFSSPEDIAPLG